MSTRQISQFIQDLSLDRLPDEVIRQAKTSIRDTLAVVLPGLETRTATIARQLVEEFGGRPEATVLGNRDKAPMALAAFANCTAASVFDFDDGHAEARFHPGAQIVMAALAVAEERGASGKAFLEAVVAGYEVGLRASRALVHCPTKHPFPHGTGSTGAYATATAAAKLLGLAVEQTSEALGIAAHHAPMAEGGVIARHGTMTKECIGWGALTGVTSALLARRGFQGPSTIFDDEAADHSWQPALGEDYAILTVYYKPHAACRHTHSALDMLLDILQREQLSADDVKQITVYTSKSHTLLNQGRPRNIEQAQYSYPFALGAALTFGRATCVEINDATLHDPRVLAQADKVILEHSPDMEAVAEGTDVPRGYPNGVAVETLDGRRFEAREDIPIGDPRRPLSPRALDEKFFGLTVPALGEAQSTSLDEALGRLEQLPAVTKVLEVLEAGLEGAQ